MRRTFAFLFGLILFMVSPAFAAQEAATTGNDAQTFSGMTYTDGSCGATLATSANSTGATTATDGIFLGFTTTSGDEVTSPPATTGTNSLNPANIDAPEAAYSGAASHQDRVALQQFDGLTLMVMDVAQNATANVAMMQATMASAVNTGNDELFMGQGFIHSRATGSTAHTPQGSAVIIGPSFAATNLVGMCFG